MNSIIDNSTNNKTIIENSNLDISRKNTSNSNFKDNGSINSTKIKFSKKIEYKRKAINVKENVKDNNDYNKKMIRVNGKLIMIKKNIA